MSHFRFQSLLLLSSLALAASGCEKKTEPAPADAPSASASTSASAAASANAAPKVDSAVENPPEGCPTKNSLVVQSKEAGKVKPGHANSYFIQWGKSKDRGQLVTANYAVDPNNVYRKIKDKEVLVVVKVRHEDKSPIAKGTFVKRSEPETEGGEKPNKRAPEFNISTEKLAGGVFDKAGTIELTHMGDKYVCGKISAKDSRSSINGEFIAKMVKK